MLPLLGQLSSLASLPLLEPMLPLLEPMLLPQRLVQLVLHQSKVLPKLTAIELFFSYYPLCECCRLCYLS
jgi:hypothetical protein